MTAQLAQAPPAPQPDGVLAMCLEHADYHPMNSACWGITLDWYLNHSHLPEAEARARYQYEVEQAILDQHVRQQGKA